DFHVTGVQTCALPISPITKHASPAGISRAEVVRIYQAGSSLMPIDIDKSFYNTGSATVSNGGTIVTGFGTLWAQSLRPGDLFGRSEERRVGKGWIVRR